MSARLPTDEALRIFCFFGGDYNGLDDVLFRLKMTLPILSLSLVKIFIWIESSIMLPPCKAFSISL